MTSARAKHTFRLPVELTRRLAEAAQTRNTSQTAVIEAALETYLSSGGTDRIEAALVRRLDRMSREVGKLAWNVDLGNETAALFVRLWLNSTAPLPESAQTAAKAAGKARWEQFVDVLTARMEGTAKLKKVVAGENGDAC